MADTKLLLIKLTSSEEILCTQISSGEGAMIIKDAVLLIYRQAKEGAMSVGFAPFMPYADGTISLNHSAISANGYPKQDLADEYNRIFGSGIVIAGANDAAYKAQ
ncbi:hypothetical protein EB001_17835 [bacterium]|nr:hypothetical protein [bacterium]